MTKLTYTEDRETFERWLIVGENDKQLGGHYARMVERANRFTAGMDSKTAVFFREEALDFAWANRHSFNLQYESKEKFWERSLRHAACTRDKWLVSVATLPGVYEKRWILGRMLGE